MWQKKINLTGLTEKMIFMERDRVCEGLHTNWLPFYINAGVPRKGMNIDELCGRFHLSYETKLLLNPPAGSRKPWTGFYGITASESGLPPLKTVTSTRTPRTTLNGGSYVRFCQTKTKENFFNSYFQSVHI